jgi:hypothetical protein
MKYPPHPPLSPGFGGEGKSEWVEFVKSRERKVVFQNSPKEGVNDEFR